MSARNAQAVTTIKHVAARAGVSFTTVSHVLNGTRHVSEPTRLRVQLAVDELGYAPSAVARALKTSQTRMVGVIVPNITNPFFAELMRGIEDACEVAGYAVFLCNADDDPVRQTRYLQTLLERRVDGLLLAAPAGDADALSLRLLNARAPVVVVDRELPGGPGGVVLVDHYGGARLAVEHLLKLGHRRIACLSGPLAFAVARGRLQGWRDALAAGGAVLDDSLLLEGPFDAESGYRLAQHVLARGDVTAIVAGNDLMAIGALRAAAEAGIPVPQKLSVIGFDVIDLGTFSHPPLTSVGHGIRAIGETAARLLLERIGDGAGGPSRRLLRAQLVERASTGPAP